MVSGWKKYKFSVKQGGFFVADDVLHVIFTQLEAIMGAQLSTEQYHMSLYSQTLEHVSMTDTQYSPGYFAFVVLLLGTLAIFGRLIRQKRITQNAQDIVLLIMLVTVILWLPNTILLSGVPTEMYCILSYLYFIILLSLHIG
jgi:hypothetical protein